jgi:hypothetical protein
MKICWPTRTRTGSTFVINLTSSLYDWEEISSQARINSFRKDSFHPEVKKGDARKAFMSGQGIDYIRQNNIKAMKYEDPGRDGFILELKEVFPETKFITSYRPVEQVIKSHDSLKESWGHQESEVLYDLSTSLYLHKKLWESGRLFIIDVTDPASFNSDLFLRFINRKSTKKYEKIIKEWKPYNTTSQQLSKHSINKNRFFRGPSTLAELTEIHTWVPQAERDYKNMCNVLPE